MTYCASNEHDIDWDGGWVDPVSEDLVYTVECFDCGANGQRWFPHAHVEPLLTWDIARGLGVPWCTGTHAPDWDITQAGTDGERITVVVPCADCKMSGHATLDADTLEWRAEGEVLA